MKGAISVETCNSLACCAKMKDLKKSKLWKRNSAIHSMQQTTTFLQEVIPFLILLLLTAQCYEKQM